MDFTVERDELEFTVTVDWNSDWYISDAGIKEWEVTGWWVTEVDGRKVDRAEAREWEALLDAYDVETQILEHEAGL